MRKLCCVLLLIFFMSSSVYAGGCWEGTEAGVVDTSSIYANRGAKRVQVRIHGIIVPESVKDRALYELFSLVKGRKVRVCNVKGSSEGEIFVLSGYERNIALELIRYGFARASIEKYKPMELKARKQRCGIWAGKP